MYSKKITLKFEVLDIEPINVGNATYYPSKNGIYLVNDGIMHMLVSVVNGFVTTLVLPNKQILDEYASQAKSDAAKCERDVLADLEGKFKVFEQVLGESLKGVAEAITGIANTKTGSDIDLAGLTKLIAVAQKPDLIGKGK